MATTPSVYTIRLEDQASKSAAKVAAAMKTVAAAADRTASAVATSDRAYQAVARSAARVAGAELRVARAFAAVDRSALKFHRSTLPKLTGQVNKSNTSWISSAKGLGLAALGLGAVALGAISAGRSFLEAAGLAQQFKSGLMALSKGDVTLSENWEKELIRLRVPLEQGRADIIALLAAFKGVRNVNAGEATNDILKLGAALGLTAQQSKSFNKVFTDIGGKGKIQREELVGQLGDVGIGVTSTDFLAQVAKQQKITFEAAEKMLGKGAITAEMAIPALIAATISARGLGNLDSEAERVAAMTTGDLTSLDNHITKIKENLGESLARSGLLDDLERLATVVERLSKLDFGPWYGKVKDIFGVVNGNTDVPASQILGVDPTSVTGKVLDLSPNSAIDAFKKFWGGMLEPVNRQALEAGAAIGGALGAGLAQGIDASSGLPTYAITRTAEAVVGAGEGAFKIESPSKVFAEQGKYIDEGLAMGIEDHADLAFASAESLADGAISEADMAAQTGAGVNQTAMANVGAAAGNALGSSGGGGAAGASVGSVNVSINVDGSKDSASVVQAIRQFFDTDFVALLERQLEGSGA